MWLFYSSAGRLGEDLEVLDEYIYMYMYFREAIIWRFFVQLNQRAKDAEVEKLTELANLVRRK